MTQPPVARPERKLWQLGVVVAGGIFLAGVVAVFFAYETGRIGSLPHRVEKLVDWGGGCSPSQEKGAPAPGGPLASLIAQSEQRVVITCGYASPGVIYFRFSSDARARRAASESRTGVAMCIVGEELLVDNLDRGFSSLCKKVDGRLVAARSSKVAGGRRRERRYS